MIQMKDLPQFVKIGSLQAPHKINQQEAKCSEILSGLNHKFDKNIL